MKIYALSLAWMALVAALPRAGAVTPTLAWDEEFNGAVGSPPNPANWSYDLGVGNPVGWGNNELESYTNSTSNAQIVADPNATDGKALQITALSANGSYTSARIYTNKSFTACRLEARARMPAGAGLWPAFWALGSNISTVGWPACGEVDVMEWGGKSLTTGEVQGSLHSPNYDPTKVYPVPNGGSFSDAYHVFAADCYPNEIVFSVDGTEYEDLKESDQPAGATWPFNAPFFILLNLAVGGNYPASPANTAFPQTYLVDYVRVYSLPSTPPTILVWPPAPPANLSAYSPAAAQIKVSWRPPFSTFGAALSGYTLARATDAAFTQNVATWNVGLSTSYLDSSAQAGSAYYYRVSAVSANGTSDPSGAVLSSALAVSSTSDPGRLINISCRAQVGTGANILIAGFAVGGAGTSGSESLLIRGSGPALGVFGVPGTLADPQLQLYSGSTLMGTNNGWAGNAQIASTASSVGAFAWTNSSSHDAAFLQTLPAGGPGYTAQIAGQSGDTGVALAEVYDATPAGTYTLATPRLVNISARVQVGTAGNILIAGFVIGGSTSRTVLIRASGPSLGEFGVTGTLPDPELQLYSGSTVLATHEVWDGDTDIAAAAATVGAFSWNDPSSNDSAMLVTLPPGAYTAQVSGASGDTGVALVEVYEVP